MRFSADWESRRPGGATARRRRYIAITGAKRYDCERRWMGSRFGIPYRPLTTSVFLNM